jgi:AcrR family transcriptional regulator
VPAVVRDQASAPRVRDRLALAAVELFQTHGYAETTIEDIASRAGIGRRTFFRYYRTKEDVIFPDHDQLLLRVRERLFLLPDEPAIDAVTEAVKIVLHEYVETRDISLVRYRLVSQVPALREREVVSVARYQRLFRERLAEAGESSTEASLRAELVASSVAAAHNQVLRRWLRGNGKIDPYPELEQALQFVKNIFDADKSGQHHGARGNDVIVLAFDSSTPTSTVVAELTKARESGALQGKTTTKSGRRRV